VNILADLSTPPFICGADVFHYLLFLRQKMEITINISPCRRYWVIVYFYKSGKNKRGREKWLEK